MAKRRFLDNSAFTLIEIIIALFIIIIAAGFVTFGISYIVDSSVDAKMQGIAGEVMSARNMQIEKSEIDIYVEFVAYPDGIEVQRISKKAGIETVLSSVIVPDKFGIFKDGSKVVSGSKIRFSTTSGKVLEGAGEYEIRRGGKSASFKLIKENGKVVINE